MNEIPVNMSVIRATIGPAETSAWAGKSLDNWKVREVFSFLSFLQLYVLGSVGLMKRNGIVIPGIVDITKRRLFHPE